MRSLVLLALAASIITPAFARSHADEKKDPNKVICKSEEVVGSRLQTKKTCLTAQQWDEMQRDTRMVVDRVQMYKPQVGN